MNRLDQFIGIAMKHGRESHRWSQTAGSLQSRLGGSRVIPYFRRDFFMLKKLLLSFICLLCLQAGAQRPNSFSFDVVQFIVDLEDFIDKNGQSSARDAVSEFAGFYNAGRFTNTQKIMIVKMSNDMLNRNYSVSPDFENYLRAMNGMAAENRTGKFDNWNKALSNSLQISKDAFTRFLVVSRNIYGDKVVSHEGSMRWTVSHNDVDLQVKGEPAFIFKKVDLICYTQGDTLDILGTNGKYMPASDSWQGVGGKADWSRVGIDSSQIYIVFRNYRIDLHTGLVVADSASFNNPRLFDQPLVGRFQDKPMGQSMGEKSTYPKFDSYRKNYTGLNFGRGKFTGGLGMRGTAIVCKGNDEQLAELVFLFKEKPALKISSKEFIVRNNKVATQKASVSMYMEKDSIYHPQLEFTYRLNDHYIILYRNDKQGISSAPFYDSYHNVEFYADELKWDLNNPKIDIDMINDNAGARFESVNHFRDHRYEAVQGMLAYNPLHRMKLYTEKRNIKSFRLEDYAKEYKSDKDVLKMQMIALHDMGFINYDSEKGVITLRPKLKDYTNAHFGNTDFDAITFESIIKRYPNATISLINNDLQIQGVPKFYFSDSQNVYIVPKDQVVTLKRNRNMDFSGRLRGGKVDFYGNGFSFDYNSFQVRLNNVDSMKFLYHDEKVGADLPIKSALQNIYGTLAIDHPYNKSGRKRYPGYPIFKSDVGSKVFYDKPGTQLGTYNRNRFFFDVDPFTMDSLNDLDLEHMALSGTLVSGNIVPDLKYFLSLQSDRSLGFILPKPEPGYPMYEGKGRGFIDLSLSDEGFFGKGEIKYLVSSSVSDQFILLLDSMNANCRSFDNLRTTIYPTVHANNVYEHWIPYGDSMFVSSVSELIHFSDNRATLEGTLLLTPDYLRANGAVNVREAQLVSRDFHLQPDNVVSDTAYFRLRLFSDSTRFGFNTASVRANVDLQEHSANLMFNTGGLNCTFNYNQYAGSFEQLLWYMDDKKIDLKNRFITEKPSSYLLSMRKSQDSLRFNTGVTTLDIRDFMLYPKKIPFIRVGDAKIFPDSNQVAIRNDADMLTLYRSHITADTSTAYHSIENSTLKIDGRFTLSGTGNYEYIDRKKNKQKFFLSEIKINPEHQLVGKSVIPDSISFYIGPKILFKGNALLKSIVRNLEYDGYFLAQHNLGLPRTDWFRNSAVVNPDSVYINVQSQLINQVRQTLSVGQNISLDSTHAYPAFFSRKRSASDHELIKVEGTLFYDEKTSEFRMGSYNKIFKGASKGNMLIFNEAKKNFYTEGRYNFGFVGSKFEIGAAGYANHSYLDTSLHMKLVMLLNFPFPPSALHVMYDSLTDQSLTAEQPAFEPEFLKRALSEVVEERNIKKITEEITDNNAIRLINDLEKTIFISDMEVKWNQPTRSLVSVGDIGINSFDKFKFERKIKGKMELVKRRSGDDFTLYLQSLQGSWYFFKYQKGIMYVIGSDPVFNKYLKDNLDKVSKDAYKLRLANISARNQFVKAMRNK
jgi:hypothetical protein